MHKKKRNINHVRGGKKIILKIISQKEVMEIRTGRNWFRTEFHTAVTLLWGELSDN
jgi:hypothetical protein